MHPEGELELEQEFQDLVRRGLTASMVDDGSARRRAGGVEAAASRQYGGGSNPPSTENFLLTATSDGARLLCAVCQGNEKQPGTMVAGLLALSELERRVGGPARTGDLEVDLRGALRAASARIAAVSARYRSPRRVRFAAGEMKLEGIAASVTAAAVSGSRLVLAHVGEGAAFLQRGGRLTRLSADHTLKGHPDLQKMLQKDPEVEFMHGDAVLRLLSAAADAEGDIGAHDLAPGDVVVLATSLAAGMDLEAALGAAAGRSAEEICAALVAAAQRLEHPDLAATVAVIRVGSRPAPPTEADPQR